MSHPAMSLLPSFRTLSSVADAPSLAYAADDSIRPRRPEVPPLSLASLRPPEPGDDSAFFGFARRDVPESPMQPSFNSTMRVNSHVRPLSCPRGPTASDLSALLRSSTCAAADTSDPLVPHAAFAASRPPSPRPRKQKCPREPSPAHTDPAACPWRPAQAPQRSDDHATLYAPALAPGRPGGPTVPVTELGWAFGERGEFGANYRGTQAVTYPFVAQLPDQQLGLPVRKQEPDDAPQTAPRAPRVDANAQIQREEHKYQPRVEHTSDDGGKGVVIAGGAGGASGASGAGDVKLEFENAAVGSRGWVREAGEAGVEQWQCPHCSRRLRSQVTLNNHVRVVHDKNGSFKCPQCQAPFTWKSTCFNHVRLVHQKVRPYECKQCSKGFRWASHLREHNNVVHLKLKEHKCEKCGKAFGRKNNMQKHMKKHSEEEGRGCNERG